MSKQRSPVYCFEVRLLEIEPPIWRLLEVPEDYTFWDLHVAIQDAMGWLDYHLHEFVPDRAGTPGAFRIGIPDDFGEIDFQAGWQIPITQHFAKPGDVVRYDYDFGDGWSHTVTLKAIEARSSGARYPRCIGGERRCPPEDCGGVPGYYRLLDILANPDDEEHDETIAWLKGHARNYHPFDPEAFDPSAVRFDNPKKRLKSMFEDD